MLRRLSADDARFRTVTFSPGLNLVVADTTADSTLTDSRNSSGKSSLVEILHFLLGAQASKHLATRPALRNIMFSLELDWPHCPDGLTVKRQGARPTVVNLDPDISVAASGRLPVPGQGAVHLSEWQELIERDLFGLRGPHPGVSGRTLLSFLMRRVSAHGFNEAVRTHRQQSEPDATTNLAYLLGLDSRLASEYRILAAKEATRRQLRKAVNDPAWGQIVGSTADLRGQIVLAEAEVARLTERIGDFQIVPAYEEHRARADEIDRLIKRLGEQDVIDVRNLDELERAVNETADTEVAYLEPVYEELGILLGEQVRKRFDQVENFHASIVRNRRRYLEDEITELRGRLAQRKQERAALGEELTEVLRTLQEGGALQALTGLQQILAREMAALEALRSRYASAQALESSSRKIAAERARLQQEMAVDLEDRQLQTAEATLLFAEYAQRLYGQDRRRGYLAIDAASNSLTVIPRIDSDESRGIGNMVIFCFDLMLAVLAKRHRRGPDFLVHDSHLFDGVDDRQLTAALNLAAEVADAEGLQYIVTLNSDDLAKAQLRGFEAGPYLREPRLTDAYENGGLFGFRF
ncbi:ABC-three component system protein [Kitasatospora sp. NPDC050463]|uniref:ABC-three component system protein n=1 Tax=Kitasatospora sp. NPDC050463 TaxID=3155786 RepID=UPI0033DE4E84